ncbi:MAG: polysaccharide deacetylase family protein [Myxococcales bacterium]|nr:polysaccharide deacetylase family protein [Myxococcales bacterium]
MNERHLAVNVDLDSISLYFQLHGLDPAAADEIVYERAVPRFLELFERCGVKATFFIVAQDLERGDNWAQARALVEAGHEIGNHTFTHPYDLIHRPAEEIFSETKRAHVVLSELNAGPIVGFRAPGYNVSPAVYKALTRLGYVYDSSILPSPPYLLAKYAVMGALALRGKRSRSIVGNPWQMFASPQPGTRHGVWEIPISVLPVARVPVIGTSLALFGERFGQLCVRTLRHQRVVNLEFHGVDLLSLHDDPIARPLAAQSDLRVPVAKKLEVFRRTIRGLAQSHEPLRLDALVWRLPR